jgi:hypothetical protein
MASSCAIKKEVQEIYYYNNYMDKINTVQKKETEMCGIDGARH